MITKKFKIYKACIFFIISLGVIVLYKYDPSATDGNLYPGSIFRELTGFYCPGCGATRALHEILNGNLQAAFKFNQLIIIFLPYGIYLFFNAFILDNIKVIYNHLSNKNLSMLVIIFLVYGILRNIPIYPFYLLAPN